MEKSNKVCVVCDIFGTSGYNVHSRFLVESLYDLGFDVSIKCNKPAGWEMGCPDKLFKILNNPISNDVVIFIGLPPMWFIELANKPKKFIGFFVWEGDKIPQYYLEHMNQKGVDQIWVASNDTKQAIIRTGKVDAPIFIVSEGVDTDLFKRYENDKN